MRRLVMLQKNPKPPLDAGQFQAFIFDLDGVVTKTAQVHATAWKKLFDRYLEERTKQEGKTFRPFDANLDYRRYVDGKPRYEGVKSFLESRGVTVPYGDPADEPDEDSICGLGNKKSLYFIQALKARDVETFPSTLALIREARAQGIKTAIVSSSKNCAAVLDAAGLTGLFDAKVDGVDLARNHLKGKPEPDMFLQAARLLGVAPERAVIFEDALAGVQAARQGSFGLV
ncbi:MAG: beta-phosphoglucomutase family hydrolase, partial [Nitrospiraceae bacterium]